MLRIRNAQMRLFETAEIGNFENRLLAHLRQVFPERTMATADAELREIIRLGLGKAKKYRMASELDVVMFVDLMIGLAPDFDERPEFQWITEILDNPRLPAYAVLDIVYQQLPQRASVQTGESA